LYELYAEKIDDLNNAIRKNKEFLLAHPHLIHVDEEECKKSIKVMIFLQRMDGEWFSKELDEEETHPFYKGNLRDHMKLYTKFSPHDGNKGKTAGHAMDYLRRQLTGRYKNEKFYFIWNNLVKIGTKDESIISNKRYKIEQEHFLVIEEEIKIIKPEIIIFLTGTSHRYENKFNAIFNHPPRTLIVDNGEVQIARLTMPRFPFVKHAYKTHCPGARIKGGYIPLYEAIVNDIQL
jgi:hypothetical protein